MDWPVCKLQVCNLIFSKFAWADVHPNFDANFDIWRQLEHFKYEMNRTLDPLI